MYQSDGIKVPFTLKVVDFEKKILEASDWSTAYNRGKAYNLW